MADLLKAADMISEALQRELGDELDIVFQCGSVLTGSQHRYSDLDMLYVPRHESTWNCITVSVNGTMIDLFPMHWPSLENMADFGNASVSILLENRIVYQRSEEEAQRFRALADRVRANMRPEARKAMVAKAMENLQRTGYDYYLLKIKADAGDLRSCILLAQRILASIFLSVMAVNQTPIDTRRFEQLLSLPKIPANLGKMLEDYRAAKDPSSLLRSCEAIMESVRGVLLAEQKVTQVTETTFPMAIGTGYVELKAGLDHVLLACDRRDALSARTEAMGLYWEWSRVLAECFQGVSYSGIDSLTEFGVDFTAYGFPDLLPSALAGDFDELRKQCELFDEHMRRFILENGGSLYCFDTLEALKDYLDSRLKG